MYPADKKRNQKAPDVEIVEAKAHRDRGELMIDGTVKKTGTKPLQGVTLFFQIFDPSSQLIATNKGQIEDELLEPSKESEYHLRMVDQVRGVQIKIVAEDHSGRDLRVGNGGPYIIE